MRNDDLHKLYEEYEKDYEKRQDELLSDDEPLEPFMTFYDFAKEYYERNSE